MSACSETRRLIDLTLAAVRQEAGSLTPICQRAWGPADAPLPAAELQALADGLPSSVMLDLSALQPGCVFDPGSARVLLNLLIVAGASLPAGGTVWLSGAPGDLFVRIAGQAAAWPTGMGAYLVNEAAAQQALQSGDNRLMPLTALLAHGAGVRLSLLLPPRAGRQPPMVRLGG